MPRRFLRRTSGTQGNSLTLIWYGLVRLPGLSAVIRPKAILDCIRQYINDLPLTSPYGSDFSALRELLKVHRFKRSTRHSNATRRRVASPLERFYVRVMCNRATSTFQKHMF